MSLGDSATPLGRVRGLGSAGHGGEHWLTERVTSIALLLLGTWLLASLLLLPKLDYRTLVEWLRAPSGAIPMALFVVIGFKHALDGVRVTVDDYVHGELRVGLMALLTFFTITTAGIAIFSILKIALAGVPA